MKVDPTNQHFRELKAVLQLLEIGAAINWQAAFRAMLELEKQNRKSAQP